MKMQTEKQQGSSDAPNSSKTELNFEQWVKQVRPLLLASVQKRGSR
ncbi:hypothetical protein AB3R30_17405 [Leptolyngbyaceae cyanobacterium UHCC 1019]